MVNKRNEGIEFDKDKVLMNLNNMLSELKKIKESCNSSNEIASENAINIIKQEFNVASQTSAFSKFEIIIERLKIPFERCEASAERLDIDIRVLKDMLKNMK